MRTKFFMIFIGLFLFLPIIQGADGDVSVPSATETYLDLTHALKSSEIQSLNENLDLFKGRHSSLIDRQNAIESLLNQFRSWLEVVSADGWDPGYEIILEDINAHPASAEKADQLSTFAELVAILRENEVSAATLAQIAPLLDQRKRTAMEAKIDLIKVKAQELTIGQEVVVGLIAQAQKAFDLDVERLSSLGVVEGSSEDAGAVSSADGADGVVASAAEEMGALQPVVEMVHEWLAMQEQIKREEIAHIEANLVLLKRKFSRLKTSQHEVRTQLEGLTAKEPLLETEVDVKKLTEALQGIDSSIAEMMRDISGLFDREYERFLSLHPYGEVWILED